MNDKLKQFLHEANADDALFAQMQALKDEPDKDKVIAQTIELAKGAGFDLSAADFEEPASELDDRELADVAGGWTHCACFVGGGGTEDVDSRVCSCIALGGGEAKKTATHAEGNRCVCVAGGYGYDLT